MKGISHREDRVWPARRPTACAGADRGAEPAFFVEYKH